TSAKSLSLGSERSCLLSYVLGAYNATEAQLDEAAKKRGDAVPHIPMNDVLESMPELPRFVYRVAKNGMLNGYVAFEILGQRCPGGMAMLPDSLKSETEK